MSVVKPPPCTPSRSFWVELTGEDSLEGHNYCLVNDDSGSAPAEPLTVCPDYRGRMGPILSGSIDTSACRSLQLELQGDEKVVVPLIEQGLVKPLQLKPPQRRYQDNLMVAVHPTLFCDAGELTYPRPVTGYDESLAAPLRTGWVYVFFRGHLWRELFVLTSENSVPVLRDTNLARFRMSAQGGRDERPPVGPRLDTLHLPARLLGQDVYGELELAFSDTQWAWQHVEALETNGLLRARRCRDAKAIKGFLGRVPGGTFPDWHRVDDLAPMRAREEPLEQDVYMPSNWLRDIAGVGTQNMLDELVVQRTAIESDEAIVDADMGIYSQTLLPRWRRLHLNGETLPKIKAGVDVLDTLRGRHLLSLTLRDPLFAARHLVQHMNQCLALIIELVNNVKKRPFGVTAELFHNNFRRETLPDGSSNPLHFADSWFDNRLDESEDGRLLRTVYEVERAALRHVLIEIQGALVRLLEDKRPENLTEVLRDLFDAEAGSDVAGYIQIGPILQIMSLQAGRMDPLLLPQDAGPTKAAGAEDMNTSLLAGEHPIGTMLLPFKESTEKLPGDATIEKLRTMISALESRDQPMRLVEAEVLRSLSDYMDKTSSPEMEEIFSDSRFGMHTLSAPFAEIGQWWLGGVQDELKTKGVAFEAKLRKVKGAFEGFADAAIPGKTTVQLNGADDGKLFVLVEMVDQQGGTLTSGAAVGATLKLADTLGFEQAAKSRPIRRFFHTASVSPIGLPPLLVLVDLFNFVNAINYSAEPARYIVGIGSALGDLLVSSGQLVSVLPGKTAWLDKRIGSWKQDSQWFSRMSESLSSENRFAQTVVRSKLQAAGWLAGNVTVSIMIWDSAANALQGRLKLASADFTKAVGVGLVNSSDIIAGRVLTPIGRQLVERTGERAMATTLVARAAAALGWGGTVSAGWVTVLGLGIYGLGLWLYYAVKDDAISQWLRGGPFSGKSEDQTPELLEEGSAYLGLLKAMMSPSMTRVTGATMVNLLEHNGLGSWLEMAESVFSFSAPALAISGEPVEIQWELEYERTVYRPLGRAGTEKVHSKTGTTRHVDYRFDGNHTLHFVVAEAQLPELIPDTSRFEYLVTDYRVKSLELSFQVKVWDRHKDIYETRDITQQLTNLDIKRYASLYQCEDKLRSECVSEKRDT